MLKGVDEVNIEDARYVLVKDADPIVSGLFIVGGDLINVEFAQHTARLGMMVHATGWLSRRVADLRRLRGSRVGNRRVNLWRSRTDSRRGTADRSPTGRRGGALRGLRADAIRDGALGVALLEWWLLGGTGRRRYGGEATWGRRSLADLAMGPHLLGLGWRRGRRSETALSSSRHGAIKEIATGCEDRRLLARARMLWVGIHGTLRGSSAGGVELPAKHLDFFLVPVEKDAGWLVH